MQSIVEKYANVKGTILLDGESGTGKSRLAKMIHLQSDKKNEQFICLNLASVHEGLMESELFGHEKGAFTGAIEKRIGLCQLVNKGTLFLDEIGELEFALQKKILRLLEEREFSPIGSNKLFKFEGRIIAATNKNLEEAVKKGHFREDLYYRLMVFNIHLSPIRNNKNDVRDMIEYFFDFYKNDYAKSYLEMDDECKNILMNSSWPGNIRQIKNCMEYLVAMSKKIATQKDLPDWFRQDSIKKEKLLQYPLAYRDALDIFERDYFNFILKHYGGRLNFTAKEIGLSKTTLITKIKRFGINLWDIKKEFLKENRVREKLVLLG